MPFVVDASVALAWLIDSERTPATDELLDRAAAEGIVAPSLLTYEIANRLGRAISTRELDHDQVVTLMRAFGVLALDLAHLPSMELIDRMAGTGLTAYDAAYLELAAVRGIPLATLDHRRREAALTAGVSVLPALPG